ncbi:MAG TPA: hypothetical protein VFK57_10540 [Vicinamibacterales bacterium]|nr:hypothetical protein [Vicinamibacterales bacterium]
MAYVKFERVPLRNNSQYTERWVQDRIADDPSLLGLGDVILKDKERIQPRAGRLDLLLQAVETNRRFEVEIQLGATDESHIIRTIEYWDIERKRYPQYEHSAVIVAEEITARFLNVITLFNGQIPLIALQLSAFRNGDSIGLVFTRVVDQLNFGLVEEDEETHEVTDRNYWETRGSQRTVAMADALLQLIRKFEPGLELKYNKFYIGLAKNGEPNNFVVFRPAKTFIRFEPRLERSDAMQQQLESAGLDVMDYDERWGRYRIRLTPDDLQKHRQVIESVIGESFEASTG